MENKNWKEELLRCKNGYKDMSGEEYFFYNYFKINGKLPNKKTHPHKRFKEHREFLDLNKQKSLDEVDKMNDDLNVGYIVECDLEYPKELHNLHNDLSVAPERLCVDESMLSEWQKNYKKEERTDGKIILGKVEKLIPNLNDKKKYILHSKNLEYYIKLGLKLTKVHRVMRFHQSRWLKPYIEFNTKQRTLASKNKDKFGKNLFKLMNNSVFGKTMENVRNRIDFELVVDEKRMKKVSCDPRFSGCNIIRGETESDNGLVGVKRVKNIIKLDKPVYVGLSILDISKLTMYKFHYEYMKPKYGDKCKLLFTDTDSLCYHVECEDLYKDMNNNKDRFDLSNYDKNHWLFDDSNESQSGMAFQLARFGHAWSSGLYQAGDPPLDRESRPTFRRWLQIRRLANR